MEVEAGPLLSYVPGQGPAAVPEAVDPVQELYGLPDRQAAGKGAEIPGLVLFDLAGEQDPWIVLLDGHLDIGVGLVIPEHGVVLGHMLLDEVVLQHQGLQLRIRHDVFETGDLPDHLVDLGAAAHDLAEVGPDPVVEVDGFSHVDDGVLIVVHDIYPGLWGQFFQFLLNIEHLSPP